MGNIISLTKPTKLAVEEPYFNLQDIIYEKRLFFYHYLLEDIILSTNFDLYVVKSCLPQHSYIYFFLKYINIIIQ